MRLADTSASGRPSTWLTDVAAELADGLEHEVEAVDVALADQPAVGVAREPPSSPRLPSATKSFASPKPQKPRRLELHEQDGRERVVDHATSMSSRRDAELAEQPRRRARPSPPSRRGRAVVIGRDLLLEQPARRAAAPMHRRMREVARRARRW